MNESAFPRADACDEAEDECCPPIRTYEVDTAREDQCCDEMYRAVIADDLPITYIDVYREWGIHYPGDSSTQEIYFCPWCGTRLPKGLLTELEQRLAAMDLLYAEPDDPRVPTAFRSDRWWKEAGL